MKRNIKGLTSIEVIIIIAIVIILGVVVYLSSQPVADNVVAPQIVNRAPRAASNNTPASDSTVPPEVSKDAAIISFVQQIRVDAESRFTGKYASTFTENNSAKTLGAGIVPGTVGKRVTDAVKESNGNIFAITSATGPTAYAVYGALPSKSGSYYCMASDGSSANSTSNVIGISGLTSKPICKP